MSVSFAKNQQQITQAWRDVVDSKTIQKWALFGYEGSTNNITLLSTGTKGLNELVREFNCSQIQYAFCRVLDEAHGLNKLVLINWQGDSSPLSRKGLCASHVGDVASYFKGCTQTITIRNDDEATEEYLMSQILKSSSSTSRIGIVKQPTPNDDGDMPSIGSVYQRVQVKSDIASDRKSFWKQQEEEEKARVLEEKKRAAEKQAQFEKERKQREEYEAKKLAETIRERDRMIEATRQAEKQESSSQSSSLVATDQDDEERVGRRSELIRLERNQETQSLISKGSIKNKRAIFEQASQQDANQQPTSLVNMSRRPSGTIVTQRINSFKTSTEATTNNIDSLSNGVQSKVKISGSPEVKREVQPVKLTSEEPTAQKPVEEPKEPTKLQQQSPKPTPSPAIPDSPKNVPSSLTKNHVQNGSSTTNGTEPTSQKQTPQDNNNDTEIVKPDQIVKGTQVGIKAKALYDYEAADSTEISFDPDDIIGFIEKVDQGWWHGSVVTGKFKGQSGLFPANYVEELNS